MKESELSRRQARLQWFGDAVEQTLSREVKRRFEAPELEGEPAVNTWYRIPIEEGMAGDGSEYHIYMKIGTTEHLCVFLSGGGVAWNEYTAARPVTGGAMAAGLPNYYWSNLRPMTQIMNINTGITELDNPDNPCSDWNFIVITYATGDFHIGDNEFRYTGEDGEEKILHFHGYRNFQAAMQKARLYFPEPDKLLIAGDSAGGFAVPAVTTAILEDFYPECTDVTLLSDSAQLLYRRWRGTAKNVWKAPEALWQSIHSSNITVDWYRDLHRIWADRLRYLYACSTRDYLLSAYYNDVLSHRYASDPLVQRKFYHQMQLMLQQLKQITPEFGFFVYKWPSLRMPIGGTVHTAVRHKRFYFQTPSGITMAKWLGDALEGKVYDVNMDLMRT